MDNFNEELGLKIPAHVAVILDGNGRWAKKRHMPRTYGQTGKDLRRRFPRSWAYCAGI